MKLFFFFFFPRPQQSSGACVGMAPWNQPVRASSCTEKLNEELSAAAKRWCTVQCDQRAQWQAAQNSKHSVKSARLLRQNKRLIIPLFWHWAENNSLDYWTQNLHLQEPPCLISAWFNPAHPCNILESDWSVSEGRLRHWLKYVFVAPCWQLVKIHQNVCIYVSTHICNCPDD